MLLYAYGTLRGGRNCSVGKYTKTVHTPSWLCQNSEILRTTEITQTLATLVMSEEMDMTGVPLVVSLDKILTVPAMTGVLDMTGVPLVV